MKKGSNPNPKPAWKRTAKAAPPQPKDTSGLDQNAKKWARLLANPCDAELSYPCYSMGVGGSILLRCERDEIYFNAATQTAGVYGLIPGLNDVVLTQDVLTSDTQVTSFVRTNGAPGGAFFDTNVNALRAVAARVEVSYPGTELDRKGLLALGLFEGNMFNNNIGAVNGGGDVPTTVSAYRTACQHVERTPQGVAAINWFPGPTDENTCDPKLIPTTYGRNYFDGHNALVVAVSGLPVATGIRIRSIVVYEIQMNVNTIGTIATVTIPTSINTPNHVIRYLMNRSNKWYLQPSSYSPGMNFGADYSGRSKVRST